MRRSVERVGAGALALLVPWALVTSYTLNFYYRSDRVTLLDSGWFAALVSHGSGLALPNPVAILPGSFYAVHMSPMLALLRLLHDAVWPGPDAAWFSLCQGAWYGMIGVAVWVALRPSAKRLALPTAILTAMSGPALATLGFPHFEVAIPALLVLFMVVFGAARAWWALPLLALVVGVREDGGLHAACVTGLVGLYFARQHRRLSAPPAAAFLVLTVLLVVGAAVLATVQARCFAYGPSALHGTYLGRPPFAHVSMALVQGRIANLFDDRAYIFGPIALILIVAVLMRDLLLAVGPLSCTGWLLVSIVARMQQAGQLSNYFGFPFMFVLAWPAICLRLRDRPEPRLAWLQLGSSVLSIVLFTSNDLNADPHPWLHVFPPGWRTIRHTEAGVDAVLDNQSLWPSLVVDDAVGSLRAGSFRRTQLRPAFEYDSVQDGQADALFGAVRPLPRLAERQARMIAASRLAHAYIVPGTMLVLRTKNPVTVSDLTRMHLTPMPDAAATPSR